jgi:hypothetical protein
MPLFWIRQPAEKKPDRQRHLIEWVRDDIQALMVVQFQSILTSQRPASPVMPLIPLI